MQFIPRVTPRWEPPLHLRPYVDVLEKAPGSGLRICFSTPPQHGKTETTLHAVPWWIKKWPHLRHAYASYGSNRVGRVSAKAFEIAQRAFVDVQASGDHWFTPRGGQVIWTSVGGSLTGEPIDGVMMIDDPIKDRAEAESPTIRQKQIDWYHGTVESRLHPGASVIVMMTRWHADDLAGYLVKKQGFTYINLKAIADDVRPPGDAREPGQALWPKHRPLDMLLARQHANPWNFASLYQGEPRPRGGALFQDPHYYTELPTRGFRVLYGVDLSYTGKTHADWSVCVELWVIPPLADDDDPLVYVVNVDRKQVDAPAFTLTLKARESARPGKMFWIAAGTEVGAGSFIRKAGIPLVMRDPRGRDKFTRALGTAELWNKGKILIPLDAEAHPWVDVFADEVTSFTGVKDPADDQVDALVSAVEEALKLDDLTLHFVPGRNSQ